jgi:quercetin dioxygenase-like cupin family protein
MPGEPADSRVSAVSGDELRPGASTPGVLREISFEAQGATLMRTRAEASASSGWHHHGQRDVLGYVVRGAARFEFGADGADATDVPEGGFFHVPAGLIHRDVNPSEDPQEIIIAVVGEGPLVVNVEGPPPRGRTGRASAG